MWLPHPWGSRGRAGPRPWSADATIACPRGRAPLVASSRRLVAPPTRSAVFERQMRNREKDDDSREFHVSRLFGEEKTRNEKTPILESARPKNVTPRDVGLGITRACRGRDPSPRPLSRHPRTETRTSASRRSSESRTTPPVPRTRFAFRFGNTLPTPKVSSLPSFRFRWENDRGVFCKRH